MKAHESIAQIAISMPEEPTSGDVLHALARAEEAGYQRALIEAARKFNSQELPAILKRQAS